MENWELDSQGFCSATEMLWGQTPWLSFISADIRHLFMGFFALSPFKSYEIIYKEPQPEKEKSHNNKTTLFPRKKIYIYTCIDNWATQGQPHGKGVRR